MSGHAFGGDWTEDKLSRLAKYLAAYRKILGRNPKARYFTTWYVDAFAGTGSRIVREAPVSEPTLLDSVYKDPETIVYRDGSAKIALGLDSPFNQYLFVEKSKTRADVLRSEIQKSYPKLLNRCQFESGDANVSISDWCSERDWNKERAVVFLDPYGMQVEWRTVEALAATKAVDLWYLFPLGVGVARLLPRDGEINAAWQKRLDLVFGTSEWKSRFYRVQVNPGLFENRESMERDASVQKIQGFIEERLSSCFARVAKGRVLRNSKSSPLYLLCFASANERGAPTALKIAQWILDD
jgi:three-Cys-motif partner protein